MSLKYLINTMFKFIIGLSVISLTMNSIYCQGDLKEITNLKKNFTELSENNLTYDLSYLEDKRTFILDISNKKDKKSYKFLEEDINDVAIFFDETKDGLTLKILSVDNGHRFIFTKIRNNIKLSNTVRLIEIDGINLKKKEILIKFINSLRSYRKSLIKPKGEEIIEIRG